MSFQNLEKVMSVLGEAIVEREKTIERTEKNLEWVRSLQKTQSDKIMRLEYEVEQQKKKIEEYENKSKSPL